MDHVFDAAEKTIGVFQFDVYIFFHTSPRAEVVSFGKASRKNGINELHLYMNPSASLEDLMEDWVAPHEISHLAIPPTGKGTKWFSEGFATYFSRQVMIELGYYDQNSFDELYARKTRAAEREYLDFDGTFPEVSEKMTERYRYSTMYWGSAGFFWRLDSILRAEEALHLRTIVKAYQYQNRMTDRNLKSVIKSWDLLIGREMANDLMKQYRNESVQDLLGP